MQAKIIDKSVDVGQITVVLEFTDGDDIYQKAYTITQVDDNWLASMVAKEITHQQEQKALQISEAQQQLESFANTIIIGDTVQPV